MTGTIKKLVRDRGFGFILSDAGEEYFFHLSGCDGKFDRLNEGDRVRFELGKQSAKGPRAEDVVVI